MEKKKRIYSKINRWSSTEDDFIWKDMSAWRRQWLFHLNMLAHIKNRSMHTCTRSPSFHRGPTHVTEKVTGTQLSCSIWLCLDPIKRSKRELHWFPRHGIMRIGSIGTWLIPGQGYVHGEISYLLPSMFLGFIDSVLTLEKKKSVSFYCVCW